MNLNVQKIRQEFPIFTKNQKLVYLDSAATAQKPLCVIDTLNRFYAEEYGTVHRAVYDLAEQATARYNSVREDVQTFLNASSSEEIVFTKGTTEAINLVAASLSKVDLNPGDEILISEMEHHSNIVPWQMACKERGAELKVIPIDDRGDLIFEEFEKQLTVRTKLVSIAHISNVTGTLNPIKEIINVAHRKGAKVLIDGAQSAPHMVVDVQDLDADFFVFSGHKAYGPTGVGILYGKKQHLEALPPYQGGGDMIQQVTFSRTTYQKPPLKFEAGTPMIAEVLGLGAALSFIERIGREKIAAWEAALLTYATEKMLEIPKLRVLGTAKHKGAIITFVIPGVHSLDLGTLLNVKGIAVRTGHLCAQPTLERFGVSAVTRVSFGVYNTFEEVDYFLEALRDCIRLLKA